MYATPPGAIVSGNKFAGNTMNIIVRWSGMIALGVPILFLFVFGFVTIQSAVKWGFWPALAEMCAHKMSVLAAS
jgi:hypothetical protein